MKEVKPKVHGLLPSTIRTVVNGITETKDAIDAIYSALPDWLKKKAFAANGHRSLTVSKKLLVLYENFEAIDADKMMKALIANAIEDLLYGKLSKHLNKAELARIKSGYSTGTKTGNLQDPGTFIGAEWGNAGL